MTMKIGVALANAMLAAYETAGGTTPTLTFFSGAVSANCAAADPTGSLAVMTLPSDWMGTPTGGIVDKTGSWTFSGAGTTGTILSYRMKTTGAVCFEQGTVTITGGGGDLTVDSTSYTNGQTITVTTWNRNFTSQI